MVENEDMSNGSNKNHVISSSNKRDADTKRMNYADHFVGQDANEAKIQNRRRKPRTKPANP
ncbi:hypothetical protein ABFA07_002421 [Porites harrisoni]